MRTRHQTLALLALGALMLAGCGDGAEEREPLPMVVLSLDFVPNAVHAPIFTAVRAWRDREHGIRLRIRQPGGGPDALKLVASGRADLGVLDIHDLAIAREQGTDLVAIAALVARPVPAAVETMMLGLPAHLGLE